jgi:hypothetical protein
VNRYEKRGPSSGRGKRWTDDSPDKHVIGMLFFENFSTKRIGKKVKTRRGRGGDDGGDGVRGRKKGGEGEEGDSKEGGTRGVRVRDRARLLYLNMNMNMKMMMHQIRAKS